MATPHQSRNRAPVINLCPGMPSAQSHLHFRPLKAAGICLGAGATLPLVTPRKSPKQGVGGAGSALSQADPSLCGPFLGTITLPPPVTITSLAWDTGPPADPNLIRYLSAPRRTCRRALKLRFTTLRHMQGYTSALQPVSE